MADQTQGNNFTLATAAGTPLIVNRQCTLAALTVLGTGNGTLAFYNVTTAAGTTAGNNLLNLALTSPTTPQALPLNANFSDGLVAVATGTINVGISWR